MLYKKDLRIVFTGGGSGGHLSPAIALAQEFSRLHAGVESRFLIPGKPLEREILEGHGMSFDVCGGRSPSGGLRNKIRSGVSLLAATWKARKMLKAFSPDIVIGAGGYASVCGGLAARSLRIPLILLEQNVVAGRVNRLMSRFSESIYAQWPLMKELPGKSDTRIMGNPIRRSLGHFERRRALEMLGLNPNLTTLLVMGGSQGAASINRFVCDNIASIEIYHRRLQVIHISGQAEFEHVRDMWAASRLRHKVLPFTPKIGPIIAGTDIALCRAGASTISDLASFGRPMILVPLPSAADDHQTLNARYAAAYGAAYQLTQSELTQEETLNRLLQEIVLNEDRRKVMAQACSNLARLDAGKRIALDILTRFGIKPSALHAENSGGASSTSGRAA